MTRYMLGTDTCSYILKRSNDMVLKRLKRTPVGDICISVMTNTEFHYGVQISPRKQHDQASLASFLTYVEVLDFLDRTAYDYAEIRAHLKSRGSTIGANDLFIAAHARSLGLTLVTCNTREFKRVPGLTFENWSIRA